MRSYPKLLDSMLARRLGIQHMMYAPPLRPVRRVFRPIRPLHSSFHRGHIVLGLITDILLKSLEERGYEWK